MESSDYITHHKQDVLQNDARACMYKKKLRKEKAGIRPKRSTIEQIVILRGQANEWRAGLCIHFVEFE